MSLNKFKFVLIILAVVFVVSVPGVFAVWTYASGQVNPVIITSLVSLSEFDYQSSSGTIEEAFKNALNDLTTYNSIKGAFDGGKTVISSADNGSLINSIFGSNPVLTINGQTVEINSILIQRANVDGSNTGADGANEYTLYLVADSNVYAMSFSGERAGNWDQLGQTYIGTMEQTDVNNLNVGAWTASSATYQIGGYEYKVGQSSGNHIDRLAKIEQLMSASDDYLMQKINDQNPTDIDKAYVVLATEYAKDSSFVTSTDEEKLALKKAYLALKNIKKYTRYKIINENGKIVVEIELNNGAPRAELITDLIAFYELMDNYDSIPYDEWRQSNNIITFYNNQWSNW